MAFIPSKYQQRLFTWAEKERGSAVVLAVAGSGKSTSVVRMLAFIPDRAFVTLLAFNTVIAEELGAKINELAKELGRDFSRKQARTFHSLGNGAVRKFLQGLGVRANVDGSKIRKMIRATFTEEDRAAYGDFVAKLVGYARGEGIGPLKADTYEAWDELVSHHDLTIDAEGATIERGIELARTTLKASCVKARAGEIDFDDMLYMPLVWGLRLFQNDWVIVDEAQDTNAVRRALAKLALKLGGRLVAVGDDRQAIYGFTGANHDAIDLIKHEFDAIELPLTISYRCPKAVGRLAQTIVPRFEVSETAPEGEVAEVTIEEALARLGDHDAILCRNTAPLIRLAYKLLAEKRACKVLGREIGEGLVNLVKKMRAKGIDQLLEKLDVWSQREIARFTAKGEEGKAAGIEDRRDCVLAVIDALPEGKRTIPALLEQFETLFQDGNGCLLLSTMHKAKGREWQTVCILDRWRMPSKWARQDWQKIQEENLEYVAYTRAQRTLLFADLPDEKKQKKAPKFTGFENQGEAHARFEADQRALIGGRA